MTAPVSPPQPTAEPVRQHTPTPWKVCNEGECPCLTISCPDHPIAKVESGEWGDEYPAMRQVGGSLENRYEAYMERIGYGSIDPDVARANALLIVEAVNSHASLKARAEQAEQEVDVLESNARVQAKLLADTGRRVEGLAAELAKSCDETRFADSDQGCMRAIKAERQIEELKAALRNARGFIDPDANPPRTSNREMVAIIDAALAPSTPAVSR